MGHSGRVTTLAFSNDGQLLASSGSDRTIKLWDLAQSRVIRTLFGHRGSINSIAFSRDSRMLASVSEDGSLRIWDRGQNWNETLLAGGRGNILSVVFSRDGQTVIAGKLDGWIEMYDSRTGEEIRTLDANGAVYSLAVSPDGNILAGGTGALVKGENSIRLWNLADGKEIRKLVGHSQGVLQVVFSPNGEMLATTSYDGSARVWSVLSGLEVRRLDSEYATRILFTPEGQLITNSGVNVDFWNPLTAESIRKIDFVYNSALSLSPSGRVLAGSLGSDIKLYDLTAGKQLSFGSVSPDPIASLAVSSDAHWMVTANVTNMKIWDLRNRGLRILGYETPNTSDLIQVKFSPDAKTLVRWGGTNGFTLWDVTSGRKKFIEDVHNGAVNCVAFRPDSKAMASASDNGTIKIWDASSGALLRTITAYPKRAIWVVYMPIGNQLVSSGTEVQKGTLPDNFDESSLKVWDADSGRQLRSFRATDVITIGDKLAVSPDGRRFAYAHLKTIRLQDAKTGRMIQELVGHEGYITSISFSPDGKWLLSAATDNRVKIWDVFSGEEFRDLTGHTDGVNAAVFGPDRAWVASGGNDGTIRFWDIQKGQGLATLASFGEGKEWAAITGGTTFDASGGGERAVALRDPNAASRYDRNSPANFRDVNAFRAELEVPPEWLHFTAPTAAALAPVVTLTLPSLSEPTVTGVREVRIKISIAAPDTAGNIPLRSILKDVRLLRNDKTVRVWTQDLPSDIEETIELEEEIPIIEGENRFEAFASTKAGTKSAAGKAIVHAEDLPPEIALQVGHQGPIYDVEFNPQQQMIASAGLDHAVVLWDSVTGLQLRRLAGHTAAITSLAFSSDGKTLASASFDKTVRVWDVASGGAIATLNGHSDEVLSVAFSPNGRRLVTGSLDRTIGLWDVGTGRELRTFQGHTAAVARVVFSPDGRTVASAGLDKTIRIWNADSGALLRTLAGGQQVVTVAYSPDQRVLVSGSIFGTIKFWDVATGSLIRTLERSSTLDVPIEKQPFLLDSIAFSPDGSTLALSVGYILTVDGFLVSVSDIPGAVKILDAHSGRLLRTIETNKGVPLRGVSFNKGGTWLASGVNDGSIRIWNISSGKDVRTLRGEMSPVEGISFTPGDQALITTGDAGTVHSWDLVSGTSKTAMEFDPGQVKNLIAISHDRNVLAWSDDQDGAWIWNRASGKGPIRLNGKKDEFSIVDFSPDDRLVAVANYKDGGLDIRKTVDGSLSATLHDSNHTEMARNGKFSNDGTKIACIGLSNLTIWDVKRHKELRSIDPEESNLNLQVFSPDDEIVATSSLNGGVVFWDVATGDKRMYLPVSAPVSALTFSPDGRLFAAVDGEGTVSIWNASDGRNLHSLRGAGMDIRTILFEPSNESLGKRALPRWLATTGGDGATRLWNPSTGQLLITLLSIGANSGWLVVQPDGLFDGTADAMQAVSWRVKNENKVIPLDGFFTDFYHPGLFEEVMSGEAPAAQVDIATVLQIPGLRAMLAKKQARLEIRGRKSVICFEQVPGVAVGSPPGDTDLPAEVNGFRVVPSDPSCKYQEDLPSQANSSDFVKKLQNAKPEVFKTPWDGEPSVTADSTLNVLTIAIGQYPANSGFDPLPYATKSAKAVEDFFSEQSRSDRKPYAHVRVWPGLYDLSATREAIRSKFNEIAKETGENDVVLIYLVGHGVVTPGQEMFYFVPVGGLDQRIRETGLNTAMLAEAIRDMPARRILLVIDACQSGGAVEALSKIGEVKARVEELRGQQERTQGARHEHGVGVYVVAATLPLAYAVQLRAEDQSALAVTLLEGLRQGTGSVGARQLIDYLTLRLPEASKQAVNYPQVPLISSVGLDFALAAD
jgi:WD40 repeat protein